MPIPDARLWSLDDPFLYEVEAHLGGEDESADLVRTYFGMREVSVMDMPAEFYAVQLIAMTNRQRLEEYIAINQLEGMTAARTERNGEIYYVLILGIYENRGLAERASLEIPPPLDTTEPWIRELGTLQEAMLRGDALAADAPH